MAKKPIALAALVVAAALGTTGGAYAYSDVRAETSRRTAVTSASTVCADADAAAKSISVDEPEALLASSEGVAAQETREVLAGAVAEAKVAAATKAVVVKDTTSKDDAVALEATCAGTKAKVDKVSAALTKAVDGTKASMLEAAVVSDSSARDALAAAVDNGEAVLAASEGRVDDNASREALRAALDTAIPVRDAATADDYDSVLAQTRTKTDNTAAIDAGVNAVNEAVAARDQRLADEARQRQKTQPKTNPAPKTPSQPKSNPAPKSPTQPKSNPAPKAPSQPKSNPAPKAPSCHVDGNGTLICL
ncbi:MAG: hypothetical protein FWE61_03595 [Micrococcales bacterium]|nr:hypothetical protein [Micrococcales bacterium]